MKKITAVLLLSLALIAYPCWAQKSKMPEVVMPKEMPQEIAVQNVAAAEKGYALYQLTCSKCHGGDVKGRSAIPDFTVEQLELYQIRIANSVHEDVLDDRSLTSEELAQITTFFMYKKPIGKPFKPKSSSVPRVH